MCRGKLKSKQNRERKKGQVGAREDKERNDKEPTTVLFVCRTKGGELAKMLKEKEEELGGFGDLLLGFGGTQPEPGVGPQVPAPYPGIWGPSMMVLLVGVDWVGGVHAVLSQPSVFWCLG